MMDATKWRLRAEEYNAIAGNCLSDSGRTAYVELALLCEKFAQRLEQTAEEITAGLDLDVATVPEELPGNRLLAALSDADVRLLAPNLRPVDFPKHHCFNKANQPIEYVYFIEQGMASVNAGLREDRQIETGLIGPEGMTSIAVVLGDDRSPFATYGEIPGQALRIEAGALREAIGRSETLRALLLNYAHVLSIQVAQTALANGRCKIEERLARWLLMANDRVKGDLPLTHEFLATMLGVRRAGVTVALHELEGRGLVRVVRGHITVVDRAGLKNLAGGSYGPPEAAYRRLIG
jgi:CRP-like cAMP-binding protein